VGTVGGTRCRCAGHLAMLRGLRRGLAVPARLDQPGFVGDDHQLCPVPGGQFHHRPADMGLRGGRADVQLPGDLGIGQPRSASRSRSACCWIQSSSGQCWSPRSTWTSAGGCGGPASSPSSPPGPGSSRRPPGTGQVIRPQHHRSGRECRHLMRAVDRTAGAAACRRKPPIGQVG